MQYRCSVCGFTTNSDSILARHMVYTLTSPEYHLEWIESKGISLTVYSPFQSLIEQKALHEDIREIVDRECRIERVLEMVLNSQ